MSATTDQPTTKMDRYEFGKLDAETQDAIARRAVQLFDGTRTRGQCWKIAMAEYRLSQPRPYALDSERRDEAHCSCGWWASSNSPRGLTTSARAHARSHSKERLADRVKVSDLTA